MTPFPDINTIPSSESELSIIRCPCDVCRIILIELQLDDFDPTYCIPHIHRNAVMHVVGAYRAHRPQRNESRNGKTQPPAAPKMLDFADETFNQMPLSWTLQRRIGSSTSHVQYFVA